MTDACRAKNAAADSASGVGFAMHTETFKELREQTPDEKVTVRKEVHTPDAGALRESTPLSEKDKACATKNAAADFASGVPGSTMPQPSMLDKIASRARPGRGRRGVMAGDEAAQAALAVQHAERTAARKNLADEESGAEVVGMTTEEKHAAARMQLEYLEKKSPRGDGAQRQRDATMTMTQEESLRAASGGRFMSTGLMAIAAAARGARGSITNMAGAARRGSMMGQRGSVVALQSGARRGSVRMARRGNIGSDSVLAAQAVQEAQAAEERENERAGGEEYFGMTAEEKNERARNRLEQLTKKEQIAAGKDGAGKHGRQLLWQRGAAVGKSFRRMSTGGALTASGRWKSMSEFGAPKKKKKKRGICAGFPCCCIPGFWSSVGIWKNGPWYVIGFVFFICNMGVIMAGALVFQDCPDVVKTWAQTVAQGLVQSWIVFDPMVIIFRNNMKNTKKRIRSKRYQMMEKAIMSPITAFLKFMGKAFSPG